MSWRAAALGARACPSPPLAKNSNCCSDYLVLNHVVFFPFITQSVNRITFRFLSSYLASAAVGFLRPHCSSSCNGAPSNYRLENIPDIRTIRPKIPLPDTPFFVFQRFLLGLSRKCRYRRYVRQMAQVAPGADVTDGSSKLVGAPRHGLIERGAESA